MGQFIVRSSQLSVIAVPGIRAACPSLRLCEWGADALSEPAPKPGAGWVNSVAGRARSNHRSLGPLTPPKAGGAPGVRPFGMTRFCGGAGAEGEGAGERSSLRGWYGAISCGRWGADALSEPAPKPGAGLVSVCGRAGEEQPQIPRSAYPAKGGGAPGVRPFGMTRSCWGSRRWGEGAGERALPCGWYGADYCGRIRRWRIG